MRYIFKACQTFFCVFGTYCATGTLVGKIYLQGKFSYVVHTDSNQLQNGCLDINPSIGSVKLRAMKPGGRAFEDVLVLTGEGLKTGTKEEAKNKFAEICAQIDPDIDVAALTKQDMIRLTQEAFIGARSPRKKKALGMSSAEPFQQNSELEQSLLPLPTLDLLKQIDVPDSDAMSATGSDKVSTASGSDQFVPGLDSDASSSLNGDISPTASDAPEIPSDLSDRGSEYGSVEINSTTQSIEDTQSIEEITIVETLNTNEVGTNTNSAQNISDDKNLYITNSETNLIKSTGNLNHGPAYKKFRHDEFIRWLMYSIEQGKITLKSFQSKLI